MLLEWEMEGGTASIHSLPSFPQAVLLLEATELLKLFSVAVPVQQILLIINFFANFIFSKLHVWFCEADIFFFVYGKGQQQAIKNKLLFLQLNDTSFYDLLSFFFSKFCCFFCWNRRRKCWCFTGPFFMLNRSLEWMRSDCIFLSSFHIRWYKTFLLS